MQSSFFDQAIPSPMFVAGKVQLDFTHRHLIENVVNAKEEHKKKESSNFKLAINLGSKRMEKNSHTAENSASPPTDNWQDRHFIGLITGITFGIAIGITIGFVARWNAFRNFNQAPMYSMLDLEGAF